MKLPLYATVNDLPVKAVRKWIIGFDILAMNQTTGDFESNHRFMTDVLDGGSEVDYFDEKTFNEIVERKRTEIRANRIRSL